MSFSVGMAMVLELTLDVNASYSRVDILPENLEKFFLNNKFDGFNVTIPHKIEMINHLDNLDDACKKIGAVNTVLNDDGILRGFNTDMDGFLEPIKRNEI